MPLDPPAASDPRLPMLLETMRSIVEASTETSRLVQTIVECATRFLGDGCAIFLVSDDGQWLLPAAIYNRETPIMEAARAAWSNPIPVAGPGPVAITFRTAAPVLIPHVAAPDRTRWLNQARVPAPEQVPMHSLLTVPLRTRDRVLGTLTLSRHRAGELPFDLEDQTLASTLADHAALALTNARLVESLQEQLRERQRAEAETKRFMSLVQHSNDFIAMAGFDGRVMFVNEAGRRLVGLDSKVDAATLTLAEFHTEAGLSRGPILREKGRWTGEGELRHFQTRELIPTQISSFLVRDEAGEPLGFATVQQDLRERRLIEEHLRQVQKMEAVGRLASGVAHDFNNLLFIILNYAAALVADLPADSTLRSHAKDIQSTAERGAALTHQLLAFSRKQRLEPRVADLSQIVTGVEEITRRILGKSVTLQVTSGARLQPVRVDVGQMEQVLMNLAVNARDAMPRGGQLTVATANVELGAEQAARIECPPGPYVHLSVRDTGTGIEPSIQSRIFDPFFTTKPSGQGTGLGLSIVFGVVKQSGGHLAVSSEIGRGTTFDIYLPPATTSPVPLSP